MSEYQIWLKTSIGDISGDVSLLQSDWTNTGQTAGLACLSALTRFHIGSVCWGIFLLSSFRI